MEYDSLYDRTPSRSPDNTNSTTPGNAITAQSLISQFMTAAVKRNASCALPTEETKKPEARIQVGVEVVVPVLDGEEAAEYDYLPGHTAADKVLSSETDLKDEGDDLFEVRLKSGEVQWVCPSRSLLLGHNSLVRLLSFPPPN